MAYPELNIGGSASACDGAIQGHRLVGPIAIAMDTGYDGAGAAYSYTCGSIVDLGKFAAFYAANPHELPAAHETVSAGHPNNSYADGWRIMAEPDGTLTYWHTGTVPGYFSGIYVNADTGDGAAVLFNSSGFLHEQELAGLTRAAYEQARGIEPSPVPHSVVADALPIMLLVVGCAVALLAVLGTPHRVAVWTAALLLLLIGVGGAVIAAGYPLRHFWLWEPGLVIGVGAVLASLCLGTARAWFSGRTQGRS